MGEKQIVSKINKQRKHKFSPHRNKKYLKLFGKIFVYLKNSPLFCTLKYLRRNKNIEICQEFAK